MCAHPIRIPSRNFTPAQPPVAQPFLAVLLGFVLPQSPLLSPLLSSSLLFSPLLSSPSSRPEHVFRVRVLHRHRGTVAALAVQARLRSSRSSSRCWSGEMNRFLFSAWMAISDSPTHTAKTTRPPKGFP